MADVDASAESRARERFAAQRQPLSSVDPSLLDAVAFAHAGRTLDVVIVQEEFTHICPMTGLPDFGTLEIRYVPDRSIVELKSLKYYLLQYRQVGVFYEHVVFHILDHLLQSVAPRAMSVTYQVAARGGIRSTVVAKYPDA